jgi:hypothetical protein
MFRGATTHAHEATEILRKYATPCLSDAVYRTLSGEFAGLQLCKTAPFVGCVGFSTKSKNLHTPLQSGLRHAAKEQAGTYLRENMEANAFFPLGRSPRPPGSTTKHRGRCFTVGFVGFLWK